LFQPLDLVTFGIFKREHREVRVKLPNDSQVWQITKLMKAIERVTDSSSNRAAFKKTGLVGNPAIFPRVAMVNRDQLMTMIAESQLSESAPPTGTDANPEDDLARPPMPSFGFLNQEPFQDA
jgi:hypothetical protein